MIRFGFLSGIECTDNTVCVVTALARENGVECGSQQKYIGLDMDIIGIPCEHFWRKISGSSDETFWNGVDVIESNSDTPVHEIDLAKLADHDIVRLYVAVDYIVGMRIFNRIADGSKYLK